MCSVGSNISVGNSEITMKKTKKQIQKITFTGLFINLALSVLKCSVGHLYKSQALFADGIHSLSDMATDLIIIIGAKFWEQPADDCHPYGHARIETLVTIIIGATLAGTALFIGWEAVISFSNSQDKNPGWAVFIVALISIIVKESLYHWTISKGKKLKSSALISNAWHHRSDALSSIPVAVAVIGGFLFPALRYLDQIAAFLISAMLLKAAWSIARPGILEICEASAGAETEKFLKELAAQIPEIKDIHAIRTRRLGGSVLADLHLLVDPNISVEAGHKIGGKFKKLVLDSDNNIVDVLVHVEPYARR